MTYPGVRSASREWLATLLAVALLMSSCSSETTIEEWNPRWEAALEQVPPLATVLLADYTSRRVICNETVGHLRSAAAELGNAPSADIAHAASTFITFAEAVFFDCPIARGEHAGFPAGYEEMNRLIAAVDELMVFEG